MPWPGDRAAAAKALGRFNFAAAPALYWLSDGIEDTGSKPLRDALNRYGGAEHRSLAAHLPIGLLPVTRDAGVICVDRDAQPAHPHRWRSKPVRSGARGETLAATRIHFKRGELARACGHITLLDGSAQCHHPELGR